MESKQELRLYAKGIRRSANLTNAEEIIIKKIRTLDIYKKANNIMIFYPMKYEINLLELLNDDKNFYFPKVQEDKLLVCPNNGKFKKSDFGVMEPLSDEVSPNTLDLIFVPALMVDENNYRLGYGGGYYDRFLAKYPNIYTIVPMIKELVCDKLPKENYDVKVDCVITD